MIVDLLVRAAGEARESIAPGGRFFDPWLASSLVFDPWQAPSKRRHLKKGEKKYFGTFSTIAFLVGNIEYLLKLKRSSRFKS